MEQYRPKRSQSARVPSPSKVTRTINRSSDDKLIACDGPHGGSYQTSKQEFPKLASDCRSCDHDKIADEHRIVFELGQRTLELPAGALMKSILADEMSKETECTRRAPSVIAKLMGLDGMPSQQSAYKQPKRSSDGFHQKTVSAQLSPYKQPKRSPDGFHQKTVSVGSVRHRKACDNQSCRQIAREQPQFKDVYEVRECSRVRTTGCKSHMSPNARHAEDEMHTLTRNFVDAKRLSADEKLHDSKEFHGETKASNYDNYLFLKSLQERDSLFTMHLHNLQASQDSHYEYARNLKESNIWDNNINAIGHLTDIEASKKIDISMSREFQLEVQHHIYRSQAKNSHKSGIRAKANELASDVPTKIVLLKPNLEGSGKSTKFTSCSSSLELVSDGDTDTPENGGCRQAELWGKKRSPKALDTSARKSRESKELAKEITRQMRNKLGEIPFNVPLAGHRGYSADESSHEVSGNDSSYESYAAFLTSHTSGRRSFHRKSSASRYAGSSVNTEGKKRLSERWKMSHRSDEFRVGAKGSTLGEMLAISDKHVWLPNLGGEMTQDRYSDSLNRSRNLSEAAEPSGISSKDGWRDGSTGSASRSKSLQTAYDQFGNPQTCSRYEACGTGRFFIPREGSRNGRKKEVNRDFSWQEKSSGGIIRLRDKKVNDAHGSPLRRKGKKSIAEEKSSSVHGPVILEQPTFRLDTVLTLDSETVREHVKIAGCVGSGDDLMPSPELSTTLQVLNDSSSSGFLETDQPSKTCHIASLPYSQCRGAQPEPPANNREADQPSPVSVLDAPFVEDLSSGSECFERVSAELHGLRMQLRLLKLETGAYNAESMLASGDEDEGSTGSSEEAKPSAGSEIWEASYMADMLVEYEFDGDNPERPVGPHIFEKLEKKYNNQVTNSSRSDRRFFFDQINSCILEIAERFTDPHPWVKPHFGTGTHPSWSKAWFEAELCKLLEVMVKQAKEDEADIDMVLPQSNIKWMNLGKYIDDIGCEIDKMLLDELVSEALAM